MTPTLEVDVSPVRRRLLNITVQPRSADALPRGHALKKSWEFGTNVPEFGHVPRSMFGRISLVTSHPVTTNNWRGPVGIGPPVLWLRKGPPYELRISRTCDVWSSKCALRDWDCFR